MATIRITSEAAPEYEVALNMATKEVNIYRAGEWCGAGRWTGSAIADCAATLPDAVYESLDEAISDAVQILSTTAADLVG